MDLKQKIKLIDDLILEDRDVEIMDYLDILEEIEHIEHENQPDMAYTWITEEQRQEILKRAANMTAKEIKAEINISFSIIYRVLNKAGVDFKKLAIKRRQEQKRADEEIRIAAIKSRGLAILINPELPDTSKIKRPVAQYSNTGFISISKKYAV